MRLLDLYCGAGGASVGYARAGFDVTGVDVNRSALRRYPFPSIHTDCLDVLDDVEFLRTFDVLAGSPPCQAYSHTRHAQQQRPTRAPKLIDITRDAFAAARRPYVIENVPGAPLRDPLILCGTQFGLRADDPQHPNGWVALRRHRLFESPVFLMAPGPCTCALDRARGRIGGAYGGGSASVEHAREARHGGYTPPTAVRLQMLGVPWMTQQQASQSIPPAYTEFIGKQLLDVLQGAA